MLFDKCCFGIMTRLTLYKHLVTKISPCFDIKNVMKIFVLPTLEQLIVISSFFAITNILCYIFSKLSRKLFFLNLFSVFWDGFQSISEASFWAELVDTTIRENFFNRTERLGEILRLPMHCISYASFSSSSKKPLANFISRPVPRVRSILKPLQTKYSRNINYEAFRPISTSLSHSTSTVQSSFRPDMLQIYLVGVYH